MISHINWYQESNEAFDFPDEADALNDLTFGDIDAPSKFFFHLHIKVYGIAFTHRDHQLIVSHQ